MASAAEGGTAGGENPAVNTVPLDDAALADAAAGRESETALSRAARCGHIDAMYELLDAGADVNERCVRGDGSALHAAAAAAGDQAEAVRVLLDAGAAVNDKDAEGCTALMCAAERGNIDVVCLLLGAGAVVNDQRSDGWTALMMATNRMQLRTAHLLRRAGGQVDAELCGEGCYEEMWDDDEDAMMRGWAWAKRRALLALRLVVIK